MKILVVEDEPLALDDLIGMLRPFGAEHTIIGCTSGAEALAHAAHGAPDLVVTDIRMPGMDGLELLRRLKERCPDFAAVVLSGHSEFEYAREGMRLGVTDYLLKPVRTDNLLQTVSSALAALVASRAQVSQLREAKLVRALLGGRSLADAEPELLPGRWGVIITVCENWESPLVWRDTAISRTTMTCALAAAGLEVCEMVGIDGRIRVLLAPLAGVAPHLFEAAAEHLHCAIVTGGVVAHTTFTIKAAGDSPGEVVAEGLRRLGQHMRFAAPTLLPPSPAGCAPLAAARDSARLLERALADGKPAAAIAQTQAVISQLRQEGATQTTLVEALDASFQLFQRYARPGQAEPLPDRATLVTLLRRLRTYDELVTWVDLQLQPLLELQRGTTTPRQLVRALVARVHASYANEIALQAFAAEQGVSLAYFSRLFKDEVGMTFSDYLTFIRVERAKELLVRGDLRPGEVGALVGYDDPKYFGQIFRRAAGMSPLDYQRSHQREP